MEIKKTKKVSRIERYLGVIQNGLFIYGLRNRLAKIGIDIDPYYWVQEEFTPCDEPEVNGGVESFTLKNLKIEELKLVRNFESEKEFDIMVKGMEDGQQCIALECNGEIAAYTFIKFSDVEVKGRNFSLKPNEAYLLNMWTFHGYRGRNLAPYLRYQSYQLLREQGRGVKYSITNYFNKSSAKFKNKLNSKNLALYLSIVLFNKFKWNFTVKKY